MTLYNPCHFHKYIHRTYTMNFAGIPPVSRVICTTEAWAKVYSMNPDSQPAQVSEPGQLGSYSSQVTWRCPWDLDIPLKLTFNSLCGNV